ncbi:MAG: DUF1508 domain-containing protein [Bergeyella sp.]|nr:DUF1508 domain-containing protein [Bergeyella sp.]
MLTSEGYTEKGGTKKMEKGISSVQHNAPDVLIYGRTGSGLYRKSKISQ